MKQCVDCYARLTSSDFNMNKSTPDGYQLNCKLCAGEYRSVKYLLTHGRAHNTVLPSLIRTVRFQNTTIIQHALSLTPKESFSCYAFTPHLPTIYRVHFTPHQYGRSMVVISENCGIDDPDYFRHEYIYDGKDLYIAEKQLYIASTLLQMLKQKRLRLEFSESDMLDSKTSIYYLE